LGPKSGSAAVGASFPGLPGLGFPGRGLCFPGPAGLCLPACWPGWAAIALPGPSPGAAVAGSAVTAVPAASEAATAATAAPRRVVRSVIVDVLRARGRPAARAGVAGRAAVRVHPDGRSVRLTAVY